MKRRNVLKGLALLPLTGSILPKPSLAGSVLSDKVSASAAFTAESNIFRSIGVEPIINCRGAFTILGGSLELPQVREAMEAASQNFVQYDELSDGISKRLAEITGAEWGMVSAGCAAGIKHITAACVTGGNPEKLIRIPDLTGLQKTEVIIPEYSRNVYDHAVRNIGVKIVHVSSAEELKAAINPKTAMIYVNAVDGSFTGQPFSLEVISKIAKAKNIPVLIDAAAEHLTIPPVHLKRGADVVAYSGGKAIRGPQCAGLMLGNKDILMSAWQASSPHHGPGRDNKVGREEMMGMLAAVESWSKRDHEAEWKRWLTWMDTISKKMLTISGVKTLIIEPKALSNKYPVLKISWDPAKLHVSGYDIAEEVGRNPPRVAVGNADHPDGTTSIDITAGHMKEGEDRLVADRLYEVLSRKRSAKTEAMNTPAGDLNGTWKVAIKFFSSMDEHVLTLSQDGNWISGTHKSEFHDRPVAGTIEGNMVKLKSVAEQPGNSITYYFSGTVNGNSIAGDIHLGEYRTAKFTAAREKSKVIRTKVSIPGGPPLAT